MTYDFFLETADNWRSGCWDVIRARRDLKSFIITKQIDQFVECVPLDWGGGWEHVTVCSTYKNQTITDYRRPIRHRLVACEPMLGEIIHMERYLATRQIKHVACGGELRPNVRL